MNRRKRREGKGGGRKNVYRFVLEDTEALLGGRRRQRLRDPPEKREEAGQIHNEGPAMTPRTRS